MRPPSELLVLALSLSVQVTSGDQCLGGSNIFTEISENSPNGTFVANLTAFGDSVTNTVKLCLSGTDADWFYLDGKNVWLNVSSGKTLDREVLDSSVLFVTLSCSEEGFPTIQYRIIVQVLNENDNKPKFLEETVMPQNISELAEVDSVVFTAKALDLDGDTLMYIIDRTTADYKYFHMDLPSSGRVLLSRPLDYESKQELEVVIHAVEMTTRERQRASVRVRISVVDGDDQYPHFLPCQLMSHDVLSVCVSPMYTANITEREELTGPITFSPGPIFAEDGDRGIMAPISYSLLSGPDSDIFQIDNITGSVSLLHPVENKPGSSILNLKVMASQVGDPRKYSITEVQVRILSANQHAPQFASTQYQAFVHEDPSPAALVSTYNSRVLSLTPLDEDFPNASNPQIRLSLNSLSNHSQLFQITPSGLLIAKTNQLQAPEHYYLQVIARDEESGETANCSVTVKVLAHGQAAPRDPSESQPVFTLPDLPILAGGLGVLIFLFAAMLCLLIRIVKGHRQQQQQMSRTSLVTEKHPSVMNPGKSSPPTEEQCYQNAAYSETPGEESAGQERRNLPSVSGQNRTKEPGKIDGNQGKQQRKTPAVAIISPAKPIKTTMDTSTIEKNKVETAQVLVITEGTDSPPLMVPPVGSCSPQTSSDQLVPTDPSQDEPDRQDGPVMWPDPPLLSRLPIVVEVNEELVEPEAERNESAPLMGSEVITPGSLMQLMEDSIEC